MDIITLTDSNYLDYINQNVIAFSFSYAGSQGKKCTIINKLGYVFYANFAKDIKHEHVEDVCAPLKTVECGMFQSGNKDKNWCPVYLGGGNFLQVNASIYDDFKSIVNERMNKDKNFFLYSNWIDIVLTIIRA